MSEYIEEDGFDEDLWFEQLLERIRPIVRFKQVDGELKQVDRGGTRYYVEPKDPVKQTYLIDATPVEQATKLKEMRKVKLSLPGGFFFKPSMEEVLEELSHSLSTEEFDRVTAFEAVISSVDGDLIRHKATFILYESA